MGKNKKINKNADSNDKEKPNTIIKKIGEDTPKKKRQLKKKIKKAAKAGLVDTPTAVLANVGESPVKQNTGKKSKAKKKAKKLDVKEVKSEVKKDVAETTPDLLKQAKKEKKKLKKKLKIAAVKKTTSESVAGPGQTIFVGNVPSNTKRVQLAKLFARCGKIITIRFRTSNGKVIFKHKMRRESPALNAYVVFDNIEAATKALELNGTTLKDQILRVQKSENTLDSADSKKTIFVGNLKYSATDDSLHQIFSSCGEIEYVRTLQSSDKKGCIGTAFVCFKSPDAVGLALELEGTILDERPIHVERYSTNKLGANNKRIAENNTIGKGKPKKGNPLEKAALELKKKNQQSGQKGKKDQENKAQDKKKKNSEFRGIKSEKKNKKPKKKIPSQMKRLANKIAPKE